MSLFVRFFFFRTLLRVLCVHILHSSIRLIAEQYTSLVVRPCDIPCTIYVVIYTPDTTFLRLVPQPPTSRPREMGYFSHFSVYTNIFTAHQRVRLDNLSLIHIRECDTRETEYGRWKKNHLHPRARPDEKPVTTENTLRIDFEFNGIRARHK